MDESVFHCVARRRSDFNWTLSRELLDKPEQARYIHALIHSHNIFSIENFTLKVEELMNELLWL